MNNNQIYIKNTFKHILFAHILLNITSYLSEIIGNYIAGNFIDSVALSIQSIVIPFSSFCIGIAMLFSSASEILCGEYMGVGNKKAINKLFTNVLIYSLGFSFIVLSLSLCFPDAVITLLGDKADPILFNAAIEYFKGFAIGIPAYILMPIISSYLYMENEANYVTVSVILLALLYALLGYGLTNIINLSYFGFGLANSLSQITIVLFLYLRLIKNKKQISFDIKSLDLSFLFTIVKLGFAAGFLKILIGFRNIYLNRVLISTANNLALAAKSILGSCVVLVDSVSTSIAEAVVVVASICVGERNRKDLAYLYKYVLTINLLLFTIIVISHIAGAPLIASIYTKDPELIKLSATYTRCYLPSTIIEVVNNVLLKIYLIFKYEKFVNVTTFFHGCILHVLFTFVTSNILKEYSVLLGYVFTEFVTFIFILSLIITNKKRMPKTIEDLILIKDDFDCDSKMNIAIDDYKQISEISKQVEDFCLNNNINKRISMLSGLCLEEMTANIFEHGYTKTKNKKEHVDIFIIIDNNEVNLRIRDKAYPFDPTTRELIFNPEDPCKNVGIKLVKTISREFTYQNIFGMNNTIITLI